MRASDTSKNSIHRVNRRFCSSKQEDETLRGILRLGAQLPGYCSDRGSSLSGGFVDRFDRSDKSEGSIVGKSCLQSVRLTDHPPPTAAAQRNAILDAFVLHECLTALPAVEFRPVPDSERGKKLHPTLA
jgi:hypothetical protein